MQTLAEYSEIERFRIAQPSVKMPKRRNVKN